MLKAIIKSIYRRLPVAGRLYKELEHLRAVVSSETAPTDKKCIPLDERVLDVPSQYTVEGILLEIPASMMSPKLHSDLSSGYYESRELGPIRANLKPTDRIVELGSATGFISTWLAKQVVDGCVFTFEANPLMLPVAKKNHVLNGVKVEIRHGFVSGEKKPVSEVDFYIDHTYFWDSGLFERAHQNGSIRTREKVKSLFLGDILDECKPTILVIDIEGGEIGLFDNISSLEDVRHIFFELHGFIGLYEIHRVFANMDRLGFAFNRAHSEDFIVTFTKKENCKEQQV